MSFYEMQRPPQQMTRQSSQTIRPQRLLRHQGRVYSSNLDLCEIGDRPIVDPNGYYRVLGLQGQIRLHVRKIKRAWRVESRKYHPDTGTDPDVDLFEDVQIAWSVLRNPETRARYDALGSKEQWVDYKVAHKIKQAAMSKASTSEEVEEITQKLAELVEEEKAKIRGWQGQTKTEASGDEEPDEDSIGYQFYFDLDVEQVSGGQVQSWLEVLALSYYRLGIRQEVKLGFTKGHWRVEFLTWGTVIVVPLHVKPTLDRAA